jgi:hypothetical protein
MMGVATTGAARLTAGGSRLLKIAEFSVTARFLMIAKDFIPEMGTKSFAIMKGDR